MGEQICEIVRGILESDFFSLGLVIDGQKLKDEEGLIPFNGLARYAI
jgi:hypothetical protein